VDNALADFYNDTVSAAKDEANTKEYAIRKWCEEKLITLAGTRSMVYQGVNDTAGMSNGVVNVLQNKYLIHAEERARGRWFELTHDRMIKPIKDSNKKWYEQRRKLKKQVIIPIIVVLMIVGSIIGYYTYNWLILIRKEIYQADQINTGFNLAVSDNYSGAKYYYDNALAVNSTNTNALSLKSDALYHLGNYTESIKVSNKILNVDHKNQDKLAAMIRIGKAYYNLADRALNSSRTMLYNLSIRYFNKVLAVDPKNEDILKEVAKAYSHLHDYSREITYYYKALAVNPKDKATQYDLAKAIAEVKAIAKAHGSS